MADAATWSNFSICLMRCLMLVTSTGLFGPRLDPPLARGLQPPVPLVGELADADGRGWKYCGSGLPLAPVNSWHSRLEPTTLPWQLTSHALACLLNATCEIANMTSG